MKKWILVLLGGTLLSPLIAQTRKTQKPETAAKEGLKSEWLDGLKFRSVGPAVTSGRIGDLAVNPVNNSEYYVAVASGGVWKTTNSGTTFEPVFSKEGSYSIGCITMDPQNPNLLWVGTGENNNQRSVAYGDGLYKTEDGGKNWKKMGLEKSEHIGMIAINPTKSNEVYVAAYGPVWSSGGDRGIYKTTDGGSTWKRVLHVSEHTGFNEVHIDPRYPNIVYATAHQRQRKVYTYIGGGPESAIYKSTDGGATWQKIMTGLPSNDLGRIGMDISPVNPDILYAIVEGKGGGVYKSSDRGASWEKQGDYSTSGNYYQEITCDPKNADKLYSMNVFLMVSADAGKTWKRYGEKHKHVDNHAIWIDPANTEHSLVGCDGGLYETWDNASTWHFKPNLPVTQFYKVATDNASPFYNIYGGTQDNFSLGGPSRTNSANGIANSDWFVTNGGDGFESQVDPLDPNIVYAQSQYGGLVRFDKKSGENLPIQNLEEAGQPAFRWNWDAPLSISRHSNKRIYHAAQFIFKSNDQGNTWQTISPDLSRGIDRNKMPIMDRVWSADAVAKNGSTDIYGQVSAFSESPLDENILVAGTDDGLIHFTQNGGKSWLKVDKIPGIPELCYVHTVWCSEHDKNVIYAAFNNHRMGDFKPYLVKTTDGGQSWTSINANLPEKGSTYCIAEDHVNPQLLFAGTEFGLFVTVDGGGSWTQMKSGLPTVAIRDLDIQRRETDLVLATFGYGFYVLDDYSPLREIAKGQMDKPAFISPVKDALMFNENYPLGMRGKGFLGESHFATTNPTVGAVFTYYVKDLPKTAKQRREEREKELVKKNEAIPYPSLDSLRAEDQEAEPYFLLTIADEQGQVVRKLKAKTGKGLNRMTWDFRYAPFTPVSFAEYDADENPFGGPDQGYRALPGTYSVSLGSVIGGTYAPLAGPQTFKAVTLQNTSLPATDLAALKAFNQKVAALQRTISGSDAYRGEMENRLKFAKQALLVTHHAGTGLLASADAITRKMNAIKTAMNGDASLSRREFETLPGINSLINNISGSLWNTSAAPTQTMEKAYSLAVQRFKTTYQQIKDLDQELKTLENTLEKSGAPYTPGRLPEWDGR